MTLDRAFAVALVVAGVVAGVVVSVGGAFFVPTVYGGFISVGHLVAVVGVGSLCHAIGRAARSTMVGAVPGVAWLVATMFLATQKAEGDLIVLGDAFGMAFLLLGTVSAAVGIGTVRRGVEKDLARED